jgi:uncharacterized protein
LIKDSLYRNIFENWVIIELMKARYNQTMDSHLYFYRDITGKEVDILFQQGSSLIPIEIKSTKTFSAAFLNGLKFFHKESPKAKGGAVTYGGVKTQKVENFQLITKEN